MSIQDLSQQLSTIQHPSLIASVIRENSVASIPMIKDQIKDNRLVMCEIIGEDLVVVIEAL